MITHRLRGLANLHAASATAIAVSVFLAYAQLDQLVPFVRLLEGLSLLPYLLCVALGMGLSFRYVQQLEGRFHRLTWVGSSWLATRQMGTVAALLFAFMFAFKDREMSRVFMGTYLVICWFVLLLVNWQLPRTLARIFFNRAHRLPTVFVGTAKGLRRLKHWMASKESLGLEPIGFLPLDSETAQNTSPPTLGGLQDLPRVIEERGIMQVIVVQLPRDVDGRFIVDVCQQHGCRLLIFSNLAEQIRHPLTTVEEEGHQFYTLQTEPLEDPLNRALKRTLDIAVSLPIVLFVLPPLYVLVSLMQRVQAPGPVLFGQMRTGHNQRQFRVLKFRSMKLANPDEARQAARDDDRIYPFGRFLRRSSLDEFPQFWNVLRGEMSIVGPRPHMVAHDEHFASVMKAYRTRFFVKPGITGLAQTNGFRGEITSPELLEKRLEHDLAYVNQWSIWLDIQLILRTARQVVFPPETAY